MKLLMCAVYDKATGAFFTPMFFRTRGEAIRSFSDAAVDDKSPFAKHPDDYAMFALGEYDDNTGAVVPFDLAEKLITGLDVMRPD